MGKAGEGKTYLARQLLQRLPGDTAVFAGAAFSGGTPPLMPICRALASGTGTIAAEEIAAVSSEYSHAARLLNDGELTIKARRRRRQSSLLPSEIAHSQRHTFFVLSEILRRVGARTRAVLFIDDIQWIDEFSIEFLEFLIGKLSEVRVLILLSARVDEAGAPALTKLRAAFSRARRSSVVTFEVPALSENEVVEVAQDYLGGPIECSPEGAAWLLRNSNGNPKYLMGLIAQLVAQGELSRGAGRWRFVRPIHALPPPHPYKTTVLARLEPLFASSPDARRLVHYAAVLGVHFDVRVASRLAKIRTQLAVSLLQRIASATGLVNHLEDTTQWAFDHELTREAVLEQLGHLASDLHREVAEAHLQDGKTPAVVIARHFHEAGSWSRAADMYGRAAADAADRFAFEDAVAAARQREHMLDRAGCPADDEERLASVEELGRYLVAAQRYGEAAEYLGRFQRLMITRGKHVMSHALARAKLNLPDKQSHLEAVELLRAATAQLGPEEDPSVATLLWAELILAYDSIGNHEASHAAFRKARAAAEASKDVGWLARLLRLSCIFRQPEHVIEETKRALMLARRHRLPLEEVACLNNLGTQYWYLQDLGRARKCISASLELLTSYGGYRKEIPLNNLALIALAEGNLSLAVELLQQAADHALTHNDGLLIRINRAVADAMAGNLDVATESLYALVAEADAAGDLFHSDCARYDLARVLLLRGRATEAIANIIACPPRHWNTDDDLILGKRAALLIEAAAAMGREPEPSWLREKRVVEVTTKPQGWLYRFRWELCDVQFWQD